VNFFVESINFLLIQALQNVHLIKNIG